MQTFIRKHADGNYYVHDNGVETVCKVDAYRAELVIPENSTGRTRTKIALVDKADGDFELKAPNKTWVDYLTPDEKSQMDALRKAAEARMPKPANLTELEKAQRALERAKAKLAALTGKN